MHPKYIVVLFFFFLWKPQNGCILIRPPAIFPKAFSHEILLNLASALLKAGLCSCETQMHLGVSSSNRRTSPSKIVKSVSPDSRQSHVFSYNCYLFIKE